MKKTDCPKVVIGVCTYNRCKDLRRLLQSLIKLDYPNFEIIVVDNNSTDQTAQIVSGFEKVKYVFSLTNVLLLLEDHTYLALKSRRLRGCHMIFMPLI